MRYLATFSGVFFLIIVTMQAISAQSTYMPLQNAESYHTLDRIAIKNDSLHNYFASTQKPYTRLQAVLAAETMNDHLNARYRAADRQNQFYIFKDNNEWADWGLVESKKPWFKRFYKYQPDFFYAKSYTDYLVKLNPLLHFEIGKDLNYEGLRMVNKRGLALRGMVGNQTGFETQITETQAIFPDYLHQKINNERAIPGEGRFKFYQSRVGGDNLFAPGVDYLSAAGSIAWKPLDRVHLQFGHGKNFIGNGIRSLFLSDEAAPYLFFRINTDFWRIHYQNLFMELTGQFNPYPDGLTPKKYAALHHLSLNLGKRANIGLFEGVVFGRTHGFELQYLNPIIFYRSVEYHLGSPDNVMLGADFTFNFLRHGQFYTQIFIDEFSFDQLNTGWWGNKHGIQAGLKWINIAGITNFDGQVEYNRVRPYTYTHNSVEGNYTHYNQPLAHPLGANFAEWLLQLQYKPTKKWTIAAQWQYYKQGIDNVTDSTNVGSNIFLPNSLVPVNNPYNNKLLQGTLTRVMNTQLTITYMPRHNWFFDVVYQTRQYNYPKNQLILVKPATSYLAVAMRLNVFRRHWSV